VLVGPNGQGKTNAVESLVYLATQRSHRVATDQPLIKAGAQQAIVGARVRWQDREQTLELEINSGRPNRARVAGAPRRPREALGVLRVVLFAPEDLGLVKGDPSGRRRFLDELVVALSPRMAGVLSDYERVLKQRNALLKSRPRGSEQLATLEVWDHQLASFGAQVVQARLSALDQLRAPLTIAHEAIAAQRATLVVEYESSWLGDPPATLTEDSIRTDFLAAIAAKRHAEIERGITLVGPHRDDCALLLAGLPARGYASHGESWSIALALRLATYALLRDSFDTGGDPVLVLDDVFAELDVGRRQRLAELISETEQVLVTAAVAHDVPEAVKGTVLSVHRDGDSEVSW